MKNYIYIIVATVGLLLAMTSCSDGEEITRTLEVTDASVLLSKEAQDKAVNVTVDPGANFTATWKGGSWGSVIANVGSGLVTITTSENKTTNPRTATVVVTLDGGFRNKVITLTQNGDTPLLSVIPNEITFDFMVGEFIAEVESNVKWSVSHDAVDWMDVNAFINSGKMVVNVKENKTYNARSTTMTVTAGTSSKEVSVQQGAGLLFIFPYLNTVDASEDRLVEFERARHSLPLLPSSPWGELTVLTRSLLFPDILYEFSTNGTQIKSLDITVRTKYMPDFFGTETEKGRSHEIMLENGYEYLFRSGEVENYWLDYGAESEYHYLARVDARGYMLYDAMKEKPDLPDRPTFDAFPYHADVAWGSHKDVAKAWEGANGGVLGGDAAKHLFFNISGDPLYMRRDYEYTTDDDGLSMMTSVFPDTDLSKLYVNTASGFALNDRFKVLLADEGFKYRKKDGGFFVYKNAIKELEVKLYMVYLPGFGTTYFPAIAYLHVPTARRSEVSEFTVSKSAPYTVVDINTTH